MCLAVQWSAVAISLAPTRRGSVCVAEIIACLLPSHLLATSECWPIRQFVADEEEQRPGPGRRHVGCTHQGNNRALEATTVMMVTPPSSSINRSDTLVR